MNLVPIMMDESGAIVESNLLMKITKEQYAEDILSGKLYLNSLRYFIETYLPAYELTLDEQ